MKRPSSLNHSFVFRICLLLTFYVVGKSQIEMAEEAKQQTTVQTMQAVEMRLHSAVMLQQKEALLIQAEAQSITAQSQSLIATVLVDLVTGGRKGPPPTTQPSIEEFDGPVASK